MTKGKRRETRVGKQAGREGEKRKLGIGEERSETSGCEARKGAIEVHNKDRRE